jgi:protein-S-isoprenylcysteine O-methyltransferase Ste14
MKGIMNYFKINTIITVAFIALSIFFVYQFLPNERFITEQLNFKYNDIAQHYNAVTGKYDDPVLVKKLQKEVIKIESKNQAMKFGKVGIFSTALVLLTVLLANITQSLFTHIRFGKDDYGHSTMPVLAACLIASALIVITVFIMVFI